MKKGKHEKERKKGEKRGEMGKMGKKRPLDPTKLGKKRLIQIRGGKKMILM